MNAREQAEKRALELYPDTNISIVNQLHEVSRQAYLKGWEEAQDIKLREAAEKVLKTYRNSPTEEPIIEALQELEKALK